jgi:PRC-barrel domain
MDGCNSQPQDCYRTRSLIGTRCDAPSGAGLAWLTLRYPLTKLHTNLPADSVTVTHWYKQNVYDPSDNKIGEIMDVLVDRDGKVTAVIVGVGGFLGAGEKDVDDWNEMRCPQRSWTGLANAPIPAD